MPVVSTLVHASLQIATVALGSPLGREVAPREIGALIAGRLAHRAGLTKDVCRLLVACGAGAGLAAVYNVPLGGTVFVLEVLLATFAPRALLAALVTSTVAAVVAWSGLGNEQQYVVPSFVTNSSLLWAAVCGPLFGLAAWGFVKLTTAARAHAQRGMRLVVLSVLNYSVIGLLVIALPQLAGNGKGAAALSFAGSLGIGLAAALLVLKVAIEVSSLRAGAEGGLLTPGLTNGVLLAVVLGGVWNHAVSGVAPGACALIGAGAFLAASMQMPLTAVVLILEFTHADQSLLFPLLLAVAGSVLTYRRAPAFFQRLRDARPCSRAELHASRHAAVHAELERDAAS